MRIDLYEQGGYAGGGITENGGNISGPLVLAGNPSQTLEAVPKQYVDAYFYSLNANAFVAGTVNPARLPAFTGDISKAEGSATFNLNNSGVVAGSYGKVTVNAKGIVTGGSQLSDDDIPSGIDWTKINAGTLPNTISGYGIVDGVSVSGATLTGFLTLTQPPVQGTHTVSKQYVDGLVTSGGIAVGDILRKPYSTTPAGFLKCNGGEVDKTTYSNLYSVIGDQYRQNTVPGNGKPWLQQYQINTTQSADITGWTTETSLPVGVTYSQSIVTKNRVYILGGGNDSSQTANVYTAAINTDGTLAAWVAGTSLPLGLNNAQAIIVRNRVYIIGGYSGTSSVANIYYAPINADGTLGAWVAGTSLPGPLSHSQAIITKNRIYLLGGKINITTSVSTVYTAPINSDGTLGAWSTGTALPVTMSVAQAAVTKNRVYLIGNGTSVYTAPINIDGTLGDWGTSTSLPSTISATQALVTKNRIYLLGSTNGTTSLSAVCSAPINIDGTLGSWGFGTPLPGGINSTQVIVTKNRVYLLGGYIMGVGVVATIYSAPINGGLNDYSSYYQDDPINYMMPGSGKPWQQQYQINTSQSNDITGWTTGTALPGGLTYSQAIVTKNRVYLLGGNTASGGVSTVYTAPINADGTLGTWTTSNSIPLACSGHSVIVTKNRLYLLGGQTSSNSATSNIYTSVINADGTIGNWVSSGNLPTNLAFFSSFISKNNIYIVGGWNGSTAVSTVYRASINTDGTLGGWVSAPSLPAIVNNSQIAVTNNRVYLLGGYNNTSTVSSVYTATINNEGLISNWSVSSSLVTAAHASQIVCTRNKLYLFGGYITGSGELSTVQTATINSDGTLNAWTTGTSLPVTISSSQAIVVNNRIYLLSNWNNGGVNGVVYTANLSGGLNDYSPYYDGTIVPVEPVLSSTKFTLPDLTADEPFGSYSYIKY